MQSLAMGVNLEDPEGNMIVNIGAQSTEVSIITGGKIIISRKIPLGGRQMNESVCPVKYVKDIICRLAQGLPRGLRWSWDASVIRKRKYVRL